MIARSFAALSALALCSAAPARAHDVWADGGPVPAWVKSACCGPRDVHHLDPGQVHLTADGYLVDGYPRVIPASRLLPSRDGDWWVFYERYDAGSYSDVYCFFGPVGF